MKKKFDREKFLNSEEGKLLVKCEELESDNNLLGLYHILYEVLPKAGYDNIDEVIDMLSELRDKFGNILDPDKGYYNSNDILGKVNDEYNVCLCNYINEKREYSGVIFHDFVEYDEDISDEEFYDLGNKSDGYIDWLIKVKNKPVYINPLTVVFITCLIRKALKDLKPVDDEEKV